MNQRKDIFEMVKYFMKEQHNLKANCSNQARMVNCSRFKEALIKLFVHIAPSDLPQQGTCAVFVPNSNEYGLNYLFLQFFLSQCLAILRVFL